jgi:iron complex outermembrane receptor protein
MKKLKIPIVCLTAVSAFQLATYSQETQDSENARTSNNVITLDEFEVRADDVTGYYSKNFISAYRINTPVRELPFNVEIVTEDFIDEIGASTIEEAFAFTPGIFENVSAGQRSSVGSDQFLVRGLNASRPKRNGFTRYFLLDTTNVAQVEVIKGPASAIFGTAEPGGVINYITKRPLATSSQKLQATIGSWDYYRLEASSTGKIDEEAKLLYRIDTSYLDRGGYRDYEEEQRTFVSPVLEYRPFENLVIRGDVEYVESESNPIAPNLIWNPEEFNDWVDAGSPVGTGVGQSFNLPRDDAGNRVYTEIADQFDDTINTAGPDAFDKLDGLSFNLDGNLSINDNLAIRSSFGHSEVTRDRFSTTPNRLRLMGDGVQRNLGIRTKTINTTTSGQVDLIAKFSSEKLEHRVIVGAEYFGDEFESKSVNLGGPPARLQAGLFFDTNPTPAPSGPFSTIQFNDFSMAPVPALAPGVGRYSDAETSQQNVGTYVSWTITAMEDRLRLLAGLRNDRNSAKDEETGDRLRDTESVNSPQVGVSYEVITGLNIYANYSESFVPVGGAMNVINDTNTDTVTAGRPPQIGEGYELGFKFEAMEGKLIGNFAYFDISRTNVVSSGTFTPTTGPNAGTELPFNFLIDGEESSGFEFDLLYQPIPEWQIRFAYSYIDAQRNDPTLAGNPYEDYLTLISGVPEHSASLFTKYSFAESSRLAGFAIGGGLKYLGERAGGNASGGNNLDRIYLDSYVRADVFANYQWNVRNDDIMKVQLYVENLTNEEYYLPGPFIGDPINVRLTLSYEF